MKLSLLLQGLDVKSEYEDKDISFVTDFVEKCQENTAFVCIKGENFDSHKATEKAKEKGAVIFIAENKIDEQNVIYVENSRHAYAVMCANYFNNPSRKLKLIGITGTNGKSTTADIIYNILKLNGKKAGLSGTIRNITGENEKIGEYTTPDCFEFNRMLNEAVENGIEYFVCEVSSQGLKQCRVDGCRFEIGIFTNISKDHLDYHKTFDDYLMSKKKLFSMCNKAIVNMDDKSYLEIIEGIDCPIYTYSARKNEADLVAKTIKINKDRR